MSTSKIPVLLDTDIGGDIDDAVCLAYLLSQPRCELLGVTTVTGDPHKRAMLVDMLCRGAGRTDIPIHSGCDKPILGPLYQNIVHQAEALQYYEHRTNFEPYTAVEFLRRTIRERPGEITLLTIGPLSNIGLLFALDPEIPSLLKQHVLMAGVFTTRIPNCGWLECNAVGDPYATAINYNTPVRDNLTVGLDVTMRCQLDAARCREKFQGELLGRVAKMAEVWFRVAKTIVFHDPLAAAIIFEPDLCKFEEGKVEIEVGSPNTAGMTIWKKDSPQKPHKVAFDVDPERFLEHYFSVF